MANKDDLKTEALGLGIQLVGDENKAQLEELIAKAKAPAQEVKTIDEVNDEEIAKQTALLKEQSDAAAAKLNEAPKKVEEKTYTREEMMKMFQEFRKHEKNLEDKANDFDEEKATEHTVRISRFDNKFIIGFKNLNTDPYFPDQVIYTKDIFNDQSRSMVPHVTLILLNEDGTTAPEVTVPLETIVKIVKKIDCKLVETKTKDASEKYGYVERNELADNNAYAMRGTGEMVQAKVNMKRYSYVVELPSGKQVEVIPDVINW